MSTISVERRDHVLLIGFNRPDKRNAADFAMLTALADAFGELERDPELRVGLVHAAGEHFTAGLDLSDIGPRLRDGQLEFVGVHGIHPWRTDGSGVTKPVVTAVQGACMTLGIELILATDIAIASEDARFGQLEVTRGIMPFGGATLRFPARVGWGNAMRWMLTGDMFDTQEALRIGLIQEVVPRGRLFEHALELATRIAAQAPLAVQAVIRNARQMTNTAEHAAAQALPGELSRLVRSEDAAAGHEAFLKRTPAHFRGR